MVIVGLLSWWYGAGWRRRLGLISERIMRIFDFFSLDLLLKTWFSPFRQIGAQQVAQGVADQFRALLDQMVSRMIGATVRSLTIITGIVVLFLAILIGLVEVIIWALLPIFPVAGAILFAIGWVPDVRF